MKITDIKMEKIRLQLTEPFKVAFAVIDYSENVLIKVITDEGICGYGEAAPITFVTGETADSVMTMLSLFKPGLIGMNPLDIEAIHLAMDSAAVGNSSAKCAVDLAMYDIIGKKMGQPVYRVLGGLSNKAEDDVTVGINTPEKMAAEAKTRVERDGFRILKLKVGINLKEDIKALRMVRETVGENIRLRVDANQGYSVGDALAALEAFQKLGIEAVEQCLPSWDLEGAAYLRRKAPGIKLMLDESIHDPVDAAKACRLDAADTFNIKLMKCGGLYPALQINAIAQANGVNCMVGCMLETKLALTAGISLVAAKKNITEADCDSFLYYDDPETGMPGGFTREGGWFTLGEEPGFGLKIDF